MATCSRLLLALIFLPNPTQAQVPLQISVKFILDANGNRPATGNLTTDGEVDDQIDIGNEILANIISELRLDLVEIVDVGGISAWYNADVTNTIVRNNLRAAAQANPGTYVWRSNAMNIYVNGFNDSGSANFPPTNDIIFIGQACRATIVIHELGHSLNLLHTFQPGGDSCADTITDGQNWTRDQIAQNSFGAPYSALTPSQQQQVDLVWFNVMSYHPTRDRLSHCQMDRESTQGDTDRGWLYEKTPTYVHSGYSGSPRTGRFVTPFPYLQDALNAGGLTGRVLVLQQGGYTTTQSSIDDDVIVGTRFGTSTIDHPDNSLYKLPTDLEKSEFPEVRSAILGVQMESTRARAIMEAAEQAISAAATEEEKALIMADAEQRRKEHLERAAEHLLQAEGLLSGRERIAVQLELAQRYRHSGNCEAAITYYTKVAEATDQKYLRAEALRLIEKCQGEEQ